MPRHHPRIASRAVRPVVAGLMELGLDASALVRDSRIDPTALNDPDGSIPFSSMGALWGHAEASAKDEFIGMHVAEALPLDSLDLHAHAMRASSTLREALKVAVRFHRLIHETTILELSEAPDHAVLTHRLPGGGSVPRQPAEFLVALWIRLARQVAPSPWKPLRVRFAHSPPADAGKHLRVFGSQIDYDSTATALHIPASALDRINPRAEPSLLNLLNRYAGTLTRFPEGTTTSERVRERLAAMWPLSPATAGDMARTLFMSVRTMNRALHADGTSFTAIRTAVRAERAENLLAQPDVSIAEIAFATGFAELSAFYRAFRRWHGSSPAEWRRRLLR